MTDIDWSQLTGVEPSDIMQEHWSQVTWRCFRKYIPRHSRVLEIGCGTGRIIIQASAELSVQGVGLDINPEALSYARRLRSAVRAKNCAFIRGDAFRLPFADNSFDAVISEGVIEHFTPDRTQVLIEEHVRVCRPGGRLVISVPNLLNLPHTYHKVRVGARYVAYPERSYTVWGLARLIRQAGAVPIACDGFAPVASLEWYFLKSPKLRWVDNLVHRTPWIAALVGFETLVVANKPGTQRYTLGPASCA